MVNDDFSGSQASDGRPPTGGRAFMDASRAGQLSSAAQLLLLGTYLLGSTDQIIAAQPDADDLSVPYVESFDGSLESWKNPDSLESLTRMAMQDHGVPRESLDWRPGIPCRPEEQLALWRDVELTRRALSAVALISLSVWSESEIQRVAASAAVHSLTTGTYAVAVHVLERALASRDPLAAEMAAVALGENARRSAVRDTEVGGDRPSAPGPETSLTIHGMWARLAEQRWYAPGSTLHSRIRSEVNSNLFSNPEYFRWSGGYSEQERRSGSDDFPLWKRAQGVKSIDTLYAHSHGGTWHSTGWQPGRKSSSSSSSTPRRCPAPRTNGRPSDPTLPGSSSCVHGQTWSCSRMACVTKAR